MSEARCEKHNKEWNSCFECSKERAVAGWVRLCIAANDFARGTSGGVGLERARFVALCEELREAALHFAKVDI
jgi:hypothetical protein